MSKWFYSTNRMSGAEIPCGAIVDDQSDVVVADVYELDGINHGPLMACAPEMLEALRKAYVGLTTPMNDEDFNRIVEACFSAIQRAEATNVR